jgi:hypothetical protein
LLQVYLLVLVLHVLVLLLDYCFSSNQVVAYFWINQVVDVVALRQYYLLAWEMLLRQQQHLLPVLLLRPWPWVLVAFSSLTVLVFWVVVSVVLVASFSVLLASHVVV